MKKLTVEEQYSLFLDSFSHCGLFLLELNGDDILYHLFQEFDTCAISFLHSATLDPLRKNGYINDEIVIMCQSLRDRYFKLANNSNKIWCAEEIRHSSDWLELLGMADELHRRLTEHIN